MPLIVVFFPRRVRWKCTKSVRFVRCSDTLYLDRFHWLSQPAYWAWKQMVEVSRPSRYANFKNLSVLIVSHCHIDATLRFVNLCSVSPIRAVLRTSAVGSSLRDTLPFSLLSRRLGVMVLFNTEYLAILLLGASRPRSGGPWILARRASRRCRHEDVDRGIDAFRVDPVQVPLMVVLKRPTTPEEVER